MEGAMRYGVIAVLLLLCGCADAVGPEDPAPGAQLFHPPSVYDNWWDDVVEASGLSGDYDRVRWFRVPGESWREPECDCDVVGLWVAPHDIYIAAVHVLDECVAKHEMLHDLIGHSGHDNPLFVDCGSDFIFESN